MRPDVPVGEGASILLVDPNGHLQLNWAEALSANGHEVATARGLVAACDELSHASFDLVILDLDALHPAEFDSVRDVHRNAASANVFLAYSEGSSELAAEALRCGEFDFLCKRVTPGLLGAQITRSLELSHLRRERDHLRLADEIRAGEIIGRSSGLRHVLSLIQEVAPRDSTVLIRGETGTGKELVARAVHRASPRAQRPFIIANCAAIPHDLMESEMFGHVKGAFTGAICDHKGFFEAAGDGTLLLDEIGDLEVALQAKILRVLEDGGFRRVGSNRTLRNRARVLASTNQPLVELIETGRFREDLYFRLHVLSISVPPLRERKEDIPLLIEHFMNRFCRGRRNSIPRFDDDATEAMTEHPWRGNVRELRNCVEQLSVRVSGPRVRSADVRPLLMNPVFLTPLGPVLPLEETKRHAVEAALAYHHGNVTHAAAALGVGRRTLQHMMKRYGLSKRAEG
jgi:DNA-binding NtrC family response regulator